MTITAHLYHPGFLPACRTGDLETVTKILNHETPQVSTAQLQDGLTEAVQGGYLAVADVLLSSGATVNRRAIHSAILRGDPATVEVFIKNGWDVNTTEFEEGTALRPQPPPFPPMRAGGRTRRAASALTTAIVAEKGHPGANAIRTLLAHGADLEPNMLHSAIEASCRWSRNNVPNKDHACAERKKGAPLHCAIWWRRLETVQVLVGEGADVVGSPLYRGMTVIQAARRRAEMMDGQGHEEAKRIWEWLTGRRWEDRGREEEGIEDVPEDARERSSTLTAEEDGW
ncbi:hypothetical protein QR685DRAFT_610183 [Neurospora intermedia]|uniref:Ankyrin n=1 Tax=Neurospora intermedia TaxID=5142 RepID=A0ABR3CXB5_NEUIN